VPAAPATAEDDAGAADLDDDVDAELDELDRRLVEEGGISREQLARSYGKEIEDVARPKVTRQTVERELAEIAEHRRKDRRAYFKDEALQKRERDLLELREALKAGPAPAAQREASEPDDQSEGPGPAPELIAEWEAGAGVDFHLEVARSTASAALDALEEDDAAALTDGFDALPPAAQTQITRFLAIDGGGGFPAANETTVRQFAESEEAAAELVKSWGREAGRRLGVARGRIGLMLTAMEPKDRERAESWFDALPGPTAAAVLRALAG
jgi:hypothetical protein